ncbi:MAG: Tol-Pal system beta propeller repeat protein TolB [Methylobacteriaceae bacterium]|nr:Tol-Pal system beta propeller repeat protein TolB [Methylobacteriaceae bacterium]
MNGGVTGVFRTLWANFKTRRIWRLGGVVAILCLAVPGLAQISTRTTFSDRFDPIPVAIVPFGGGEPGTRISTVVAADLQRSGYFILLDSARFPETPDLNTTPNFEAWWETGARAVLIGRAANESGRIKAEFRLWNVQSGAQLTGQQFFTAPAYWRRISHIIADSVYSTMTGLTGFFDTRVAFVDETGPRANRIKRLAVMDQDGQNVRYLTQDDSIIVTPRYSPVAQEITFMSQRKAEQPRVQVINLDSGARQIVGNFPDMTSSPRFTPDGQRILLSLQQGGDSNIYRLDLATRTTTRITDTNAIDTSASSSPDGSRIVFESDRGGSQQVYVMNSDGSGAERITFGDGAYSQPVWSPRGDYIAFVRQKAGVFAVGIIKPDGSGERILAEGFHNEGPTWAPNGQYLMFFRDSGGEAGGKLIMADIFGQVEMEIPTPSSASDPAWSPLLSTSRGAY